MPSIPLSKKPRVLPCAVLAFTMRPSASMQVAAMMTAPPSSSMNSELSSIMHGLEANLSRGNATSPQMHHLNDSMLPLANLTGSNMQQMMDSSWLQDLSRNGSQSLDSDALDALASQLDSILQQRSGSSNSSASNSIQSTKTKPSSASSSVASSPPSATSSSSSSGTKSTTPSPQPNQQSSGSKAKTNSQSSAKAWVVSLGLVWMALLASVVLL